MTTENTTEKPTHSAAQALPTAHGSPEIACGSAGSGDPDHLPQTCKMREDLQTFRVALADAIRRPMGVIPKTAEGLLSNDELDAAEQRRAMSL